jgi:hypothetical protein
MSPLALAAIIFALLLAGIFVGALLRKALPQTHLSKDTQDVVRLGAGLIATISGLLLGLLIASAKGSYDTESTQVKQITADVILLDNLLAKYGPEASSIRNQMRNAIEPFVDRLWREQNTEAKAPFAGWPGGTGLFGYPSTFTTKRFATFASSPRRAGQYEPDTNTIAAVCGVRQQHPNSFSRYLSFLVCGHLRNLQFVLATAAA